MSTVFHHFTDNLFGDIAVAFLDAGIDPRCRCSRLSSVHNRLDDRYFSQELYPALFGVCACPAAAEDVVAVFGQFGGREPRHVLDDARHGDVDVFVAEHLHAPYHVGHGDLLGGAVVSNDEQFLRECRLGTLMHFGSVMAPFTAFLVCRGLKTLGVRMKQYNESALKIAKWLEANPKIETVRYPFLESNPQYAIAKKQMRGGGGMISFDVAGGLEAGKKFINSLKLCTLAVSLGDTETLVEQAAAMTHTMIPKEIREAAGITDGMIRMSVGLEDPDDIIADLKQALGD